MNVHFPASDLEYRSTCLTGFWSLPKLFHEPPELKETQTFLPLLSPVWIHLCTVLWACFSHSGPSTLWTPKQAFAGKNWQYFLWTHKLQPPRVAAWLLPYDSCSNSAFHPKTEHFSIRSVKINFPLCSTGSSMPNLFTVLFFLLSVTSSLCDELAMLMSPLPFGAFLT